MDKVAQFIAEVEAMIEKDKPFYYGDGRFHQTTIYDGESYLVMKMKKLYEEKYKDAEN